jgi:hypothetical protein
MPLCPRTNCKLVMGSNHLGHSWGANIYCILEQTLNSKISDVKSSMEDKPGMVF